MQVRYFGYSFINLKKNENISFDIRPFLDAFCKLPNPQYKNTFHFRDENVYLIKYAGNLYYLISTKNQEIIKKIDSNDISIAQIDSILKDNESIGFSSYIYVRENFIGFAVTTFSPKALVFSNLINQILTSINLSSYLFTLRPYAYLSSRTELTKLDNIGRVTMQVDADSSFFQHFYGSIGADVKDYALIDAIEITIKPKKNTNIKKFFNKVLQNVPDQGLEKMVVKGGMNSDGFLADHFLTNAGSVFDTIKRDEAHIQTQIEDKILKNKRLLTNIKEDLLNGITPGIVQGIDSFYNINTWNNFIFSLPKNP